MPKWLKTLLKRPKYSIGQLVTFDNNEIVTILSRKWSSWEKCYNYYTDCEHMHVTIFSEPFITEKISKNGDLGCL